MNVESLAKFPLRDEDDWIKTVVIGGVLVFLGFLFVPILVVWGYLVEVIRGAVAGETEPPQFAEWGDLAVDGLKAFVIMMVYQIVPAVVGIGFIVVFGAIGAGTDSGGLGALGIFLGVGAWSLLGLLFAYFAMAGLANFAVEGSLGAGFAFGTVTSVSLSGSWLMAWAFYLGLSIVAGILGSITGGLGSPFATFYAMSAGGRAFGEAFAAETGTGAASDEATATATA